jgi:hypothetical protein
MVDKLINLQRLNCPDDKLLSEKDLKRIITRTGGIYNETNECILWNGYITHNKIDYINFYFKGKKCALHRLLYINFKGKLNDNDYLEYICQNKYNRGKCCNINHIIKKKNNYIIPPILSPNTNTVYFD